MLLAWYSNGGLPDTPAPLQRAVASSVLSPISDSAAVTLSLPPLPHLTGCHEYTRVNSQLYYFFYFDYRDRALFPLDLP